MSSYLIDTNVVSETTRKKPHPGVVKWLGTLPKLVLPAVGVYELASGIRRLPAGPKRAFLEEWLGELMGPGCEVLPFDSGAALECASLEVEARQQHRTIETRDLFILATAKSKGLGIATRNVEHFRGFGVPVYDPFRDTHVL